MFAANWWLRVLLLSSMKMIVQRRARPEAKVLHTIHASEKVLLAIIQKWSFLSIVLKMVLLSNFWREKMWYSSSSRKGFYPLCYSPLYRKGVALLYPEKILTLHRRGKSGSLHILEKRCDSPSSRKGVALHCREKGSMLHCS